MVDSAGPSGRPVAFDELKPNDLVRVRGDYDCALLVRPLGTHQWAVRELFSRYEDPVSTADIEPVWSHRKPYESGWLP